MAKDPSTATIRGRLAADPEYRQTNNGIPVANVTILSSGWEKDSAGQPVDLTPTSWRCEAWRELAEHISQTFGKGDQVIAVVRPKTDKYQRDDGSTGYSTRWVIDDIGPSLQRAIAQITRQGKNGQATQRPAPQPPQPPANDYNNYPANDPWN